MADASQEQLSATEDAASSEGGESSAAAAAAAAAASALRDNIEKKGKNAYYYAHAHKADGPKWDGKPEPKLLSRTASMEGHLVKKTATFDIHKSNITKYSFLDDGAKVKLYIDLDGVGEKCTDEDVNLDYTGMSFSLTINNYMNLLENKGDAAGVSSSSGESSEGNGTSTDNPKTAVASTPEPRCLCFNKLTDEITNATFRLKTNRVILTLTKANPEREWHTVNDKGTPDHEVV